MRDLRFVLTGTKLIWKGPAGGSMAEVRASLRGRMAASPLCDGKRFATNLMTLLRDVWHKWLSGA